MDEIVKHIVEIFKDNKEYFENVEWVAYYDKYNKEDLCFQDKWNFAVSNLVSKDLTDNKAVSAEKLKPFYEWLGTRIKLCLNLQKGLSNEELKQLLDNKQKDNL